MSLQEILYALFILGIFIFVILARNNWDSPYKKSWAYNWNFGKRLFPKAAPDIQKLVGFIFWMLIYAILGYFMAISFNPERYDIMIIAIIVGAIGITVTSLTRNS